MAETYDPNDILAFQVSVLELTGAYEHVPVIALIGALHTSAYILTSAAFEPSDEEGED